jgi:RNA polymerase sigma-70 factor (ECF subfamily)
VHQKGGQFDHPLGAIALNKTPVIAAAMRDVNQIKTHCLERFYDGDADAFDELYAAYFARLVRRALSQLPARLPARQELAEDLASEVFAKVVRTRNRPASRWQASKGCVGKWLVGILNKQIISFLRAKRGKERVTTDVSARDAFGAPLYMELQLASLDGDAEQIFSARQSRAEVAMAIESLSKESREVLRLKYWLDEPYREISRKMGMSVPTVSRRVQYAQETLREMLGDETLALGDMPEMFA